MDIVVVAAVGTSTLEHVQEHVQVPTNGKYHQETEKTAPPPGW